MQYLSDSNWWSKRYHKGKGISRNRVWMPLGSTLVQKNVLFLSYSNIKLILENFFIFLVQCIFSSTIPFFHPLSLNGSNLTETLETVHYGTFRSSIWKYTRSSPDNVNNCNNNWILYNWVEDRLLYCSLFFNERIILQSNVRRIDWNLSEYSNTNLTKTLLFGNTLYNVITNTLILSAISTISCQYQGLKSF